MRQPPRAGFGPAHLMVVVAIAELAVTRLAVNALDPAAVRRPDDAPPAVPGWYALLDNLGLFLLYFGATLGVGILAVRAWELVATRREAPARALLAGLLAAAAATAAAAVTTAPSGDLGLALHVAWAAAVLGVVVPAVARRADLGVAVGVVALAAPLLLHFAVVLHGNVVLSARELDDADPAAVLRGWGLHAMVVAAMVTPYCFAPRPVARALTRLVPLLFAAAVGVAGALLVRASYEDALRLASLAVGLDLVEGGGVPASELAMYLLALATLGWTLAACATSPSPARREVGMGMGLVVLGGYGFDWPAHFLASLVGLLVIVDAAPRLRAEESSAPAPATPAIGDEAWQAWVARLGAALGGSDAGLRCLTMRGDGDGDGATTVLVTERRGVPVRLRLGRVAGALVSIDLTCGREVADGRPATLTLHAAGDGALAHAAPPAAAGPVVLEEPALAARFTARGDAAALAAVFDADARAQLAGTVDGWVAWWAGEGLRWRVFPGLGAPADRPVPVHELAFSGEGAVAPLVTCIDLLAGAAARGLAGEVGADGAGASAAH